ncbi:MAG TPA: hypothetical protein VFO19_11040 [Vicinamibacterales bacterium]|nr:hypothetical protein [Vicinamibacterales bacterium]
MRSSASAFVLVALTALAGCETDKSSSPLSPTVAGPIAGVDITQPVAMQPANNSQIATVQQPITLTIGNAATNGVRPLSYTIEIASDITFASILVRQTGIPSGAEGRTLYQLSQNLQPERTYYWHVMAQDGANAGVYSEPSMFRVYTPVIIHAPIQMDPTDGAALTTRQPTMTVANSQFSGPAGAIRYTFEVATDQAMAGRVAFDTVDQQTSRTSHTLPQPLLGSTRYFWRVRAGDATNSSPWSSVRSFVTGAAAPTPQPGPGPGPGGGGGSPNDALSFGNITIVKGENIANWAVTSTMGAVRRIGTDFCTPHSKAGQWPVLGFFDIPGVTVEGNQWMFANIGGRWYGGAGEWLRPGQTCKTIDHVGSGVFYDSPPMNNWHPSPGETIGVAVSTPARSGQWGTAERSNIVLFVW